MTKDRKTELKHLVNECNSPKGRLMELLRRIEAISPPQARKLERIIGRLEAWQTRIR